MPNAFLDPVTDPVGDLVSRYVRTHGPFTAQDAATRLGLGIAIVTDTLKRLASDRRVVEGEFRPGATGSEWVDAEVLRRLRSRSLAALRSEVEPVAQQTLGRFLPDWQHVGQPGTSAPGLRGIDGVVSAIDQLAGVALPASTWESLVLPSRVRDYSPAMLDELTTTGEVLWSGRGELSGGDGWLALHLADTAPLTLAEPTLTDQTELHGRVIDALAGGGAFFFRQLATALTRCRERARSTTRTSPSRSGTSPGPGWSATTRSPRCAPGSAPRPPGRAHPAEPCPARPGSRVRCAIGRREPCRHRPAHRRRAAGACSRPPRRARPCGRPRSPSSCSSATAS